MNIAKIKKFVLDHKIELAFTAGYIVASVITITYANRYLKTVLVGEKWDLIQAFENVNTHELRLVVHKINGSVETITIPPVESK